MKRNRSENIAFKMMPDGDIRAFQSDTEDKRGVSEWMITNPYNVAPTVISAAPPKVILYDDFHSQIPNEQNVIGTIRPTFSRNALRNGYKIIEVDDSSDI